MVQRQLRAPERVPGLPPTYEGDPHDEQAARLSLPGRGAGTRRGAARWSGLTEVGEHDPKGPVRHRVHGIAFGAAGRRVPSSYRARQARVGSVREHDHDTASGRPLHTERRTFWMTQPAPSTPPSDRRWDAALLSDRARADTAPADADDRDRPDASRVRLGRVFVANMTGNIVFLGFAFVGARLRASPAGRAVRPSSAPRGGRRRRARAPSPGAAQHRTGHSALPPAACPPVSATGASSPPGRRRRRSRARPAEPVVRHLPYPT
jgi:hypothetical protein